MRSPRTPAQPRAGSQPDRWLRPVVLLPALIAAALAFSLWLARFGLPGADEGAILTNAVKLLRGGVYYRDIDAYPFPLATYLLAGWIGVFGEHLAVSRGLATLFYLGIVVSLYACALTLVGPRRAALFGLALLPLKYLAWPSFTAYAYWDVAFAFGCVTLALLLCGGPTRGPARLAAAGFAAGLTILSKQNLGIYLAGMAGLSLLLSGPLFGGGNTWRSGLREALCFGTGIAVPLGLAVGAAASAGVLPHMLESGLIRPFTGYLPTSGIPFLTPLAWWELGSLRDQAGVAYVFHRLWRLLFLGPLGASPFVDSLWLAGEIVTRILYLSVPVAFLGAALLWLRARRGDRVADVRDPTLFALLSGAVFLSALPRADYSHVIAVYPVVLLLVYALWARAVRHAGRETVRLELAAVALASGLCVPLAAIDAGWHAHRLRLERADTWVTPDDTWIESIVGFVEAETQPGDPIFVYGQQADLYFLTGRRSSWPFAQLYPGQTGEDSGRSLTRLLLRERPKLVLRGLLSWPGLPSLADEVPRLHQLLNRQWQRVPDVFERFPMPMGREPEWWVISVLRPCEPERPCFRFGDFIKTQRFKLR
jgi:hypothetical protein